MVLPSSLLLLMLLVKARLKPVREKVLVIPAQSQLVGDLSHLHLHGANMSSRSAQCVMENYTANEGQLALAKMGEIASTVDKISQSRLFFFFVQSQTKIALIHKIYSFLCFSAK